MVYKVFGGIIILVAGVLAFLVIQDQPEIFGKASSKKADSSCVQLTPAEQLIQLIDEDLLTLRKNGNLPKAWDSIATVEYRNGSELARALLGRAKPGIQRIKEGTHYLEVEVLDLPDEKDPGIILQMSLFDIKSKNKIFELGRTYTMNQLNKQSEEKPAPAKSQQAGQNPQTSIQQPQQQEPPTQEQQNRPTK
jgi:hypothetical protein